MLSKRLKDRDVFASDKKTTALDLLDTCTHLLVLAMKTSERFGTLTREDIEDYVIACMESYEQTYYTFDDDEFDRFVGDLLGGKSDGLGL